MNERKLTNDEKRDCKGSAQLGNEYLILTNNDFEDRLINVSGFNKKQINEIKDILDLIII